MYFKGRKERIRRKTPGEAKREFFELGSKKIIALQTVWVQCDTEASHMCIFPSDGTNRIRFTGHGYQAKSQPDASGPPKTICYAI